MELKAQQPRTRMPNPIRPLRTLILGAAGRDFHDYLMFFRNSQQFQVVGFTATQIPYIAQRHFPTELAGPQYPDGIPIHAESALEALIAEQDIEFVFLAYSDLPEHDVMQLVARVQTCGAAFAMLGSKQTQLRSSKPVIAVTATRTGAGKSPVSQWLAQRFAKQGIRAGVLRHPMPYGDLNRQRIQRFASASDLDDAECTVEEREEYAPYIEAGLVIHVGVDYAAILHAAESESDLILWDGGNNDVSFIRPDLLICVADALRPGHELSYYPSSTNIRSADIVLINKVDEARTEDVAAMTLRIQSVNPRAQILQTSFHPELTAGAAIGPPSESRIELAGKRVLIIEDSPTTTHGGMASGAGLVAALRAGLDHAINPRDYAVGSIAAAFATWPHIGPVLPALGYSVAQRADLAQTIARCNPEVIVDASPAGMEHLYTGSATIFRVRYPFMQRSQEEGGGPDLAMLVDAFVAERGLRRATRSS